MAWEIPYIIKKFLERKCLKWARMTHLDIWNTSYGQKKGWESNWQFDSRPLKVGNWPDFIMCRWRVTYYWKDLDKGYNFALDLISIKGLLAKLWGPKITGVPTLAILRLPLGSPKTKCHLDVGLTEYTIRGKVVASPQVWVVVSLVNSSCPWLVLAPKVLQLCINHLVFGLYRLMWVVDACHFS
jgi:hypothetical protein